MRPLFLISLALAFSRQATAIDVSILEFVNPKKLPSLYTEAIQSAINKAGSANGGRVIIPNGTYVSATLTMRSNVTLYLEAGATLRASQKSEDYPSDQFLMDAGHKLPFLIYAKKCTNIGLEGRGVIDGQARQESRPMEEVDTYIARETELAKQAGIEMKRYYTIDPKVRLIYIEQCDRVSVKDLTIQNSPNWTLHVQECTDVNISGIALYSNLLSGVNADGIDVDDCQRVRISNCLIETGDDAICLKSTRKANQSGCDNIVVTNCNLVSTSTALKLGTESWGYFKNISFSNCVINNSNRGIGIFIRDGARVENVSFDNIIINTVRKHFNWWGDGDPIHLVIQKRRDSSIIGSIRGIRLSNISATSQGTSHITAIAGATFADIKLVNVNLTLVPETVPDKRVSSVIVFRNLTGLTVANGQFAASPGLPPASKQLITMESVKDASFSDLLLHSTAQHNPLVLKDCENIHISNMRAQTTGIMQADGLSAASIYIKSSAFPNAVSFEAARNLNKKQAVSFSNTNYVYP